jgi:DNA-directed RNA polymerase specialized sigma24 family protein
VEVTEGGLRDRRFEDFFVFEYPRLVGALRLVTGDTDRARDAVDEACARAWERLSRGRPMIGHV